MTNIIIDHQSTFTAYILALSIYFKYLHLRNLKIIIIENEISQSLDTKPWCGISTLNNFKLSNQDFINYLIQFTITLGSISIRPVSPNPDTPIKEIMNTTIDSRNYVGLLYHPIDLMNKIRFAMFRSGRVLFVSPNVNFNQPGPLHQNLSGIRVVTTTAMRNSHNINSFIYHSNMIGTRCRNGNLPSQILWLPKFSSDNHINCTTTNNLQIMLDLSTEPYAYIDLSYALKQCDMILDTIDKLMGSSIPLSNRL